MPDESPVSLEAYERIADAFARIADTKAYNAHYDRPATLSLLPDVRGSRALDAGCGPGFYAEALLRRGADVTAFDVTPRMVTLARERLAGRAEVHLADLAKPLDFLPDAKFDVAVCALALDYVRDWRAAFSEFRRVLRPGGCLVFSCAHPSDDFYKHWPEGNYFEVERVSMTWRAFGEPVEMPSFRRSLSEVVNPLLDAGLRLDRVLEPQPQPAFRETEPRDYENLMRTPGFLCIRAVKPAH